MPRNSLVANRSGVPVAMAFWIFVTKLLCVSLSGIGASYIHVDRSAMLLGHAASAFLFGKQLMSAKMILRCYIHIFF